MNMTRRSTPVARTRRHLAPEPLEARIAPAAISWTGTVDDDWNNDGNWSGGLVPGALDDVTIDALGAAAIVHASGFHSIRSLTVIGDDSLTMSGGSLAVTSTSFI